MKNVTTNVYNSLASKDTGEAASTYISAWVHNTTDSTTKEITRVVHSVDEETENAMLSVGVLHTDAQLGQYIDPTIQTAYDYTSINTQDSENATRSATFRYMGLQFNIDDASVYFGASQQARIRFRDGNPSFLQTQFFDPEVGDYVTKSEVSSGLISS